MDQGGNNNIYIGWNFGRSLFVIIMKKARVMTKPKAATLDPQGIVVKRNLEKIGIKYLNKISIGKYIEVELADGPEEEVKENIQEAIDKLLYNSIMEDYEVIYE